MIHWANPFLVECATLMKVAEDGTNVEAVSWYREEAAKLETHENYSSTPSRTAVAGFSQYDTEDDTSTASSDERANPRYNMAHNARELSPSKKPNVPKEAQAEIKDRDVVLERSRKDSRK